VRCYGLTQCSESAHRSLLIQLCMLGGWLMTHGNALPCARKLAAPLPQQQQRVCVMLEGSIKQLRGSCYSRLSDLPLCKPE
jgi:hypothetical protein